MVGAVTSNGFGVGGRRAAGTPPKAGAVVKPILYGPGTWTFTAPVGGLWTFRLRGASGAGATGANGNQGSGAGGSFARRTVRLAKGQTVPLNIAFGGVSLTPGEFNAGAVLIQPSASTVTFADGVMTAGAGSSSKNDGSVATGGVASGGDVNYTGGNGGVSGIGVNPTQGNSPNPGAITVVTPFYGAPTAGDDVMPGASGGVSSSSSAGYPPPSSDGGGGCWYYNGGSQDSNMQVCHAADGGHARCLVTYEGP